MADKKISALTALAQGDVAVSTDVLPIVDTSATETKKIAVNALVGAAAAAGLTNVDINSGTIDGATIATSDITVGAGKTLNVSAGTLTLADNQISGDKVEGGTINAITINTLTSTAVNATTVDATNIEVTNLKAKDGTAAGSIADSTGIVTLASSVLTTTDINGGSIDGTMIGANSAAAGTFTTATATTGNITTVNATTVDTTNVEITNIKAKDGTAAGSIADSTGVVTLASSVLTTTDINGGTIDGTAIGASSASTGAFSTISASGNLTLSGGTASGVVYLNGSKVATSGSALTFDGTTLGSTGLIVSTNRGQFKGNSTTGFAGGGVEIGYTGTIGIVNSYDRTASAYKDLQLYGADIYNYVKGSSAIWDIAGSNEVMRLTSTGLGIGTSSPVNNANRKTLALQGAWGGQLDIMVGSTVHAQFGTDNFTSGQSCRIQSQDGIVFNTGGATERMRLDSSGNLGLGVTPSAWSIRALQVGSGFAAWSTAVTNARIFANTYYDGAYKYVGTGRATQYEQDGYHAWYTSASGTAGNAISFTQAMTLDASGNLGIGTTTIGSRVTIGDPGTGLAFSNAASGNFNIGLLAGTGSAVAYVYQRANSDLLFGTNNTERARITSGGYSKFSNTGAYQDSAGSYHEFRSNGAAGEYTAIIGNSTSTDANAFGVRILYGNADPNGTGNQFLNCADWNGSSIVTRAEIRSNGGLANYQANNVDLSDARTKKDIIPAASMWGKVSALEIVTYKYNDQTHDDVNLGVIAQQVETVEPVWVDADGFGDTPEDGVPIKTVYTKDITFAAIKALQEAMARIETLEAKVTALESK